MRWRGENVRPEGMLRPLPVSMFPEVYVRYFRDESVVVLVGEICAV
jgi:hypothetical protein